LALIWIEHFWRLLTPILKQPREKGNEKAIADLMEALKMAIPLISRFEQKFAVELGSLEGARDLLTMVALELTISKAPGMEEIVPLLLDWSAKIVVAQEEEEMGELEHDE
jgi:hypothetical protein